MTAVAHVTPGAADTPASATPSASVAAVSPVRLHVARGRRKYGWPGRAGDWLRDTVLSALFGETCLLCNRGAGALCGDCRVDTAIREARRKRCARCAEPVLSPWRQLACARCREHPPGFDRTLCGADYAVPIDGLDRDLKYRRKLAGARVLGQLLADAVRRCDDEPMQVLVAIPLSRERLAERGYNQARLIARHVARELGLPLAGGTLRRAHSTRSLAGLGAAERRDAIADVFAAGRAGAIRGRSVGLIDDVMTTGATFDAAARVLRSMGATRVVALPALRTPPRQ